ncbi:MAG: hypothetical protein ACOYJ2_03755 [Rickettsiales bacterium]
MIWLYAVILAVSAGLITWVLSRTAERIAAFFGLPLRAFTMMSYVALSAIAFLMVALIPTAIAVGALFLWFVGTRDAAQSISFFQRAVMIILLVVIAMSDLPAPRFALPEAIPNLAVMLMVLCVWSGVTLMPIGAPTRGVFAAFFVSLALFFAGPIVLDLPYAIATDALVISGALLGGYLSMRTSYTQDGWAGNAAILFLVGFLIAHCAYAGAWWLGLLAIAPLCLYALIRKP